jgi:hypothetical protein
MTEPRSRVGPLREVENQLTMVPLLRRQFGSSITGSSWLSAFSLANRNASPLAARACAGWIADNLLIINCQREAELERAMQDGLVSRGP